LKASKASDYLTMFQALQAAAAKDSEDSLSVMKTIEQRAHAEGYTDIAALAATSMEEVAGRVGARMGLPAEWDVVLELAGASSRRLLKKSEETQVELKSRLQQMVDETFTGWGGLGKQTRTRDRFAEAIATRLEVMSVVYVQNAENYFNFLARRQVLTKECPPSMRTNWGIRTDKVSLAGVGRHSVNPLDPSINEHYLWHGTSPAGAAGITDTDFDMKRAGTAYGTLFGCGLYFAESCMKADEYVKPDARGWFPLILCRVVLGNINYCDIREPVKIAKKLEASCSKRSGGQFHSVLGDREKVRRTFREFIVYDSHQVYPEYIVWYKRMY
jgi:hypothetical protein